MRHLGAELQLLGPGRCVVTLPFRTELTQQDGFFHAGVLTTVADSAAGYAAFTPMPAVARVLTVELEIDLPAPARARSPVARWCAPGALTLTRAEVVVTREGEEVAVARLQATMIALRAGGS